MKRLTHYLIFALVLVTVSNSWGAILGQWALTANGEGETEDPGKVTVGAFTGGPGIGAIIYGNNGGYASGWTLNPTVDVTDYFEVTLTPKTGYGLVITQVDFSEYRSGTGPLAYTLRASTDNFATYVVLATENIPDNTNIRSHSMPDLNVVVSDGQTLKLRFYGYSAEGAAGNWRIQANTLKIRGEIVSTSEPPTITFMPSDDVQVHVSNLLEVAVSLFPATGSGIQSWTLLPAPSGSNSFAAGLFSFNPTAADEAQTFTLSVTATNSHGSTMKELAILVTEYLPPGTLEITFENPGEVKSASAPATVNLSGHDWILDQVIIGEAGLDVKLGKRAARYGTFYPSLMTSTTKILPAGLGSISFLYAMYQEDNAVGSIMVVEVADTLDDSAWLEVGRVSARNVNELTKYQATVNVRVPMYIRIRTDLQPGDTRVNIDNILITPYEAPNFSAYETFLLNYNVTPGDPGTLPGDDYDGDGFTNQQEFDANTNPYDDALHP